MSYNTYGRYEDCVKVDNEYYKQNGLQSSPHRILDEPKGRTFSVLHVLWSATFDVKDVAAAQHLLAGESKMRRKTNQNWSVNSASTESHHHDSQYSLRASNQSAETAYKLNKVTSRQTCVVNADSKIALLTTKQGQQQEQETQRLQRIQGQEWDYETYLTNRFMRLKTILGRSPELVELYNAGFTQEEIDLMENITDWLYVADDLEEWGPSSSPKLRMVKM